MEAASRIERVTVYRDGARVERALELGEPAVQARFVGLPLTLDDASLRARVSGTGTALDVHVALDVPPEDPALAAATDEALEAARKETDRAQLEVTRLQTALARLDALKILPRPSLRDGEPPIPIPLQSRERLVAVRISEERRLAEALATANAAFRDAEKKLSEVRAAHDARTTARNAKEHELRKVVTVALAGVEKGATVTLEYAVPSARWSPSYVLTLPTDRDAPAKLAMRALVAQRTGEDWTGVKLRLSTAAPDTWVELPELSRSRIGRAQPPPRKAGFREPPEGANALYADYDAVAGAPAAPSAPARHAPAPRGDRASLDDLSRALPPPAPMAAMPLPPPAVGSLAAPAQTVARARPPLGGRGTPPAAASKSYGAEAMPAEEVGESPEVEPAIDWSLSADTLAYGRLRLHGPRSRERGELTVVSQSSVYVEGLGAGLRVDVAAQIRVALNQSRIDTRVLPPGYELAHSHDAYDYVYATELPCDVPSHGVFHSVAVAAWEAPTKLRHVAVPREAQQVYRLLEVTSPLDAALLVGPIDVYDGGAYRTTTRMPATPPRGRIELGLGVEPAVKIARKTTFQEEAVGLLGGSLALSHHVGVELRNLLQRPVTVEVRERLPVIRKDDADVKIEVGRVEPAWESWDQEQTLRGGHLWRVALEPGAARTLSAEYTIKIAGKLELVGGNRRES